MRNKSKSEIQTSMEINQNVSVLPPNPEASPTNSDVAPNVEDKDADDDVKVVCQECKQRVSKPTTTRINITNVRRSRRKKKRKKSVFKNLNCALLTASTGWVLMRFVTSLFDLSPISTSIYSYKAN